VWAGLSVGGYARPAAAAGAGPNHAAAPAGLIQHHVHEMKIPNDLIGCIIGRGGSKINEIRYISFQWRIQGGAVRPWPRSLPENSISCASKRCM